MTALARACPADHLHVVDLPYRFSSWAFDYPDNIALWVNPEGQLLAWAVMQTPFWTIDYACRPDAGKNLHRQILDWADRRARGIRGTSSGRPMWFVNVLASQAERIHDLEEAGFASQANVDDDSWSKVQMRRSSQTPVAGYSLPAGFTIRPLAGHIASHIQAYVELHRAVFENRNMTIEWRTRTLSQPEYIADLDLVAVAQDGRLAAFCMGWLDRNMEQASGQIEPLGVRADCRHLGLGRAILLEALSRLQFHGASQTYAETDRQRNAALELYESVGFQIIRDVLVYRKDYEGT